MVVGGGVGLMVAAVVTYVMPKQYESGAVLQVRPSTMGGGLTSEFEMIRSAKTLEIAASELELEKRWSMDTQQVLGRLREIVEVENIHGTDLIKIDVRATNPRDAKDVAAAVSRAYRMRRAEWENEGIDGVVAALREAVMAQEKVVEEKRRELASLIRSEGLTFAPKEPRVHVWLERQKIERQAQMEKLSRHEGTSLFDYGSRLDVSPNPVRMLDPGFTEDELAAAVESLKSTLAVQLELIGKQMAEVEQQARAVPPSGQKASQAFEDLRADSQTAQDLLEQLKVKLIGEEMQRRISEDPVIVHEEPVEAEVPVSPKVALNLVFGTFLGVAAGLALSLVLVALSGRKNEVA